MTIDERASRSQLSTNDTDASFRRGSLSSSGLLFSAIAVPILAALVFILQFKASAYSSEFGSHPDEAAHFVTGIFAYDSASHIADVRRFADVFYAHYPKVGLGHWPPLFYAVQAVWYRLFGVSCTAAMALMGLLTTLLAFLTATLVRKYVGSIYAIPTAALLIAAPLIQRFSASVMTEILVAVLTLSAAVVYGSYLAGNRPMRNAILFGILASAAIMTKGSGLLLALIPPLATLIDRRFSRLATFSFWLPAAIVALLCSPFYLYTLDLQRNGMQHESFEVGFILEAVPFYSGAIADALGYAGGPLLVIGAGTAIWASRRTTTPLNRRDASIWTSLTALVVSVLLFCFVVPCGLEARHLIPAIAPSAVLAARGFSKLLMYLRARWEERWAVNFLAIVSVVVLQVSGLHLYQKDWGGYRPVVSQIHSTATTVHPVCLIVGDPRADGMFVAEAVASEVRPSMFALRASKLLASGKWDGREYRPRFRSTAEVERLLDELNVEFLVVDSTFGAEQTAVHHQQLADVINERRTDWIEIGRSDARRNGRLYPAAIQLLQRMPRESLSLDDPNKTEAAIIGVQGSKTGKSTILSAHLNGH
ncbi:MAG: ArnT family glycosyltransferase [Aureliella sp.]